MPRCVQDDFLLILNDNVAWHRYTRRKYCTNSRARRRQLYLLFIPIDDIARSRRLT
jgi:hypothetical protein